MKLMGSMKYGVWSCRFDKANIVLTLKAPWNLAGTQLFSERYGYYKHRWPLGFGWRLILR